MSSDAFDHTADSGQPKGPHALAPGRQLGKYKLDRILGEGGMGVVWAAHDPDLERAVAIKVLRYAQASVQLRQRLLREARAMAKLKHPNVLTVYEVGTVDDRDYIAMELVNGTTLDQWLGAKPPEEEVWNAVIASGRGLAAAHEAGVVHRDFKPHNVLRSRDGRVLVTDFGLARGLLGTDDAAAEASDPRLDPSVTPGLDATIDAGGATVQAPVRSSGKLSSLDAPRPNDSVLDSPLTQTGALIGTPAYMAPEQYLGMPPDPRTDQFAFCVTAWQALSGERPFHGSTLDEMRKSASAGVAHVQAKLPSAVRAVLARGLDPKAELRWPSMEELLDALARAAQQAHRRTTKIIAGLLALAIAATTIVFVTRKDQAAPCAPPERAFAEAWSPQIESELRARSQGFDVEFNRAAEAMTQFRGRWLVSYQQTCSAPKAKGFAARHGCLEGLRDEVSVLTALLRTIDPKFYAAFDAHGMLPNVAVCEVGSPPAPALIPVDQPRRSKILAVMAKGIALHAVPDDRLPAAFAELAAEAATIGWPPLVPLLQVTTGNDYMRRGMFDQAHELYRRAEPALKSQNANRWTAMLRMGQLETSMHALENPRRAVPASARDPRDKTGVLHKELGVRFDYARSAIKFAGDPMLTGALALSEAMAQADLAQWNRYKEAYEVALVHADVARKQFESIGDVRRAAIAAATKAEIYLRRGDERALDDALVATRSVDDMLDRDQLARPPSLDEILATIAFARRDFREAHRRYDRLSRDEPSSDAPVRTGTVVVTGAPPATAVTIVAWAGELHGDPARLYTDRRTVQGEIVVAAKDGTFTIHAHDQWGIVAQAGDLRSTPQRVGTGPITLQLKPTTTLSGTIDGPNLFGVHAIAKFAAGDATWFVHAPIERDATFHLGRLPPGVPVIGAVGPAGQATRTVLGGTTANRLVWPSGLAIEVILRAKVADDAAAAWVFSKAETVLTRREVELAAKTSAGVATSSLGPVGSDNTDTGREIYHPGDRHAVITGNPDGVITVCAAATRAPDSPVACKTITTKANVIVEYSDGRRVFEVEPVVIEL